GAEGDGVRLMRVSGELVIVLSMAYVLGFALYLRFAQSTGARLPLTLPPLLLTTFAAWIACARLAQRGGADTGEARMLLAVGGSATFLTALMAAIASRRARVISPRRPPILVPAIAWLTSFGALAMRLSPTTGFAAWNLSLFGAFVSLTLLPALAIS